MLYNNIIMIVLYIGRLSRVTVARRRTNKLNNLKAKYALKTSHTRNMSCQKKPVYLCCSKEFRVKYGLKVEFTRYIFFFKW